MRVFNNTEDVIILGSYRIPPKDGITLTKEEIQVLMAKRALMIEAKELFLKKSLTIVP